MGGDDSQKLLPRRGSAPLRAANLRLHYEITNVTETAVTISRTPPVLREMEEILSRQLRDLSQRAQVAKLKSSTRCNPRR